MRIKKGSVIDAAVTAILVIFGLACLVPVLNTISISFSDRINANLGNVYLWPLNPSLIAYQEVIKDALFLRSFLNSIFRLALGVSINVLLTILMAYPLSRDQKDFRMRNVYMWFVVVTMLFSGGLVPTFLLVNRLRLTDTIWALVLPVAVPVYSILILMNYFRTAIPRSLESAALIDGASPPQIMWRIFVPLAMPAIAVVTLFSIVHHWNAFFDGLIYINTPSRQPLQTYMQSLLFSSDIMHMADMSPQERERQLSLSGLTFNSAKLVIAMIPMLAIYPFLQRYFVSGVVMGAVKE